jgi:transcriptional regulator with XRE-family HTH domain
VELGNKNITVEYLSYICEALDISLADFFSDSFSERMSNDFVTSKIYRLTEKQRAALLAFLDAMAE